MLTIRKMRADHVVDFAAEELKKYLRMMMPRCGEIKISYEPGATEGFRLGLLEDFGLPSEAKDPVLDDVVHIDTDTQGGILAGSNSRSVLFAVYRFLKLNGCRWLYPGIDGEYIPWKDITPQQYHKLADTRFRGRCNEGAQFQPNMMEALDFFAKQELNVYMIEFDNPFVYYDRYYRHPFNSESRFPEPIQPELILQYKRQCEAEISKRGLMFHDMGHGWTAEPFGLNSVNLDTVWEATEEQRPYLAMINGVRELRKGKPLNTNLCMSQPKVRTIMADAIVNYAEKATNVDYLHVWLADMSYNHCECEDCQKMRPSDWYMMVMNEVDEKLTAKGLDTRIVFICYVDTLFAPEYVTINNPQRFSLLYAPITRSYSSSVTEASVIPEPVPYVRNNWQRPRSAEANLAMLRSWQKVWKGPCFEYEYHFWRAQYRDPGGMYIARRIYEDICSLGIMNLDGIVEDGSERSLFPNGFAMHIYAEALLNRDCDYNGVMADYFSHIYGPDWQQVRDHLQKVSDVFDFSWLAGGKRTAWNRSPFYDPSRADLYEKVKKLAEEGEAIAMAHMAMPTRPQCVSYRLLLRHCEFIRGMAECMTEKALGNDEAAMEKGEEFTQSFGRHEFEIERYYDHFLFSRTFKADLANVTTIDPDAEIQ